MSWFTLLPDALSELAALSQPPAAGASRRHIGFGVDVTADGATAPGGRVEVGVDMLGAGDVVGFERQMISRVEPAAGAAEFEPNYFPFVEFVDADFPWRYALRIDQAGRRLPWLALLALRASEFEFVTKSAGPLPSVRILDPSNCLPNLDQSWAFAHVHVAHPGEQPAPDLAALVAGRPDLHFSRLMAPRKLEANTAYTLVLTATTEAGRLAGLGRREQPTPFDKPAWGPGVAAGLELPVYFQSRFTTSSLADFELLARRLKPYRIDAGSPLAAPVEAFAGAPGHYAGYANPAATFEIQDALMRADRSVQPVNTDPQLQALLKVTLEKEIAGEQVGAGADGPDKEDPLIAMPPYGWRFRKQKTLDAGAAAQGRVVDRVNLDLKFRHVAGLGAETVRRNQEKYMGLCWAQYDAVVAANQAIARLRAAREMAASLRVRRIEKLDAQVVVTLAEPLHAFTPFQDGKPLAAAVAASGTPASYMARGLRRSAAKRAARSADSKNVATPMPALPGAAAPTVTRRAVVDRIGLTVDARRALNRLIGEIRPDTLAAPPRPIAIEPLPTDDMRGAIGGFVARLPTIKAGFRIKGLLAAESEKLDPIMRAPTIADPLVEALKVFSSGSILRATDSMPNNTVAVVKENRAFVEAFLLGANHEMNNELRWREFPTDMRGTVFARFWDRKRAPSDPTGDDIPPLHTWSKPLGQNYPPHDTDRKEALVLLVRGDLVRRFGEILVVVNHAPSGTYHQGQGVDSPPVFKGRLGDDLAYFGFDVARDTVLADKSRYFFVLYEAPGRVRFGLDIGSAQVRRDRFRFATAALAFPLVSFGRDPAKAFTPAHLRTAAPAPVQPTTWDQLSWSHMRLDAAGYIDFVATAPQVSEAPNYWSLARDSASLARSFWQKPIAAVMPATRVL